MMNPDNTSMLDYEPQQGDEGNEVGAADVKPSTGSELNTAAYDLALYQSSIGRERLQTTAIDKLRGQLDTNQLNWLDSRRNAIKKTAAPGGIQTSPLAQYKQILAEEGAPFSFEDVENGAADELRMTTERQQLTAVHTVSEWPLTQMMAGTMGAVVQDPVELAAVGLTAFVTGGMSLPAILGLEALAGVTSQAVIQAQVVEMYKELGLEEMYGPKDTVLPIMAGGLLPPALILGFKGVGKAAAELAGARNKFLTKAADELDKAGELEAGGTMRDAANAETNARLVRTITGDSADDLGGYTILDDLRTDLAMDSMARNMPPSEVGKGKGNVGSTVRLFDEMGKDTIPFEQAHKLVPGIEVDAPMRIADEMGVTFNTAKAESEARLTLRQRMFRDLNEKVRSFTQRSANEEKVIEAELATLPEKIRKLQVSLRELSKRFKAAKDIGEMAHVSKMTLATQEEMAELAARSNALNKSLKVADTGRVASIELDLMRANSKYVPKQYRPAVKSLVENARHHHSVRRRAELLAKTDPTKRLAALRQSLDTGALDYGVKTDVRPTTLEVDATPRMDEVSPSALTATDSEALAALEKSEMAGAKQALADVANNEDMVKAAQGCVL